jgi:hypothetical protein
LEARKKAMSVEVVQQLSEMYGRLEGISVIAIQKFGAYRHALVMFSAFFVTWHFFAAIFAILDKTKLLWKYKLVGFKDPVRVFRLKCFVLSFFRCRGLLLCPLSCSISFLSFFQSCLQLPISRLLLQTRPMFRFGFFLYMRISWELSTT